MDELKLIKEFVESKVKSVQSVVQLKMKSCSATLLKTYAVALAPHKIRAAKEDRRRNLIVYRLEESKEDEEL